MINLLNNVVNLVIVFIKIHVVEYGMYFFLLAIYLLLLGYV